MTDQLRFKVGDVVSFKEILMSVVDIFELVPDTGKWVYRLKRELPLGSEIYYAYEYELTPYVPLAYEDLI